MLEPSPRFFHKWREALALSHRVNVSRVMINVPDSQCIRSNVKFTSILFHNRKIHDILFAWAARRRRARWRRKHTQRRRSNNRSSCKKKKQFHRECIRTKEVARIQFNRRNIYQEQQISHRKNLQLPPLNTTGPVWSLLATAVGWLTGAVYT